MKSLLILIYLLAAAGDAKPPGDCSSIFLGSLSETNAVHIPSTGIYHSLDGTRHHDRPVYQHTSGHAYMYFLESRRSGQRFWAVGPEVGSEEAEMATSAGDSDKPEVTQQKWRLWNNESESWSTVSHLKAVCVDEEFGPCTSGRLRMTGLSGRNGLQKRRMGLYVLTNRTHDLRPVYKHEEQDEFLFYTTQAGGKWIVGPEVGKVSGGMFASDFALRPEFIVQTWVVFAGRYFGNDPGVKLKCQGQSSVSLFR